MRTISVPAHVTIDVERSEEGHSVSFLRTWELSPAAISNLLKKLRREAELFSDLLTRHLSLTSKIRSVRIISPTHKASAIPGKDQVPEKSLTLFCSQGGGDS